MSEFSNDELEWAKKVIEQITPEASGLDLDFYPLQSKFKKNPKVLFLGLNPGGGSTYLAQSTNEKWDFEISISENNEIVRTMKEERLLNGNPFFNIESESWALIKGLKRIPLFNAVLESEDFVLANYYFLSTAKFNFDEKHKRAIEKSKQLAYEMINLINPKVIVVLGTSQGIDLLNEFQNKKTVLQGNYQRLIVTAEYNGIKTIAILHPSTMAITTEEVNAIETNINEILSNSNLTSFNFKKINFQNFDISKLESGLASNGTEVEFKEKDSKSEIFEACINIGRDSLLLQINLKDKYFGIRDNKPEKTGDKRFYKNLVLADEYLNCFENESVSNHDSWLIYKHFEDYNFVNVEDLQNQICGEIIKILDIKKINKKAPTLGNQ